MYDMLECYFTCNKNTRLACAKYRHKFVNRQVPNHTYFGKLARKLQQSGSFDRRISARTTHENQEIDILGMFETNGRLSVREVSDALSCSPSFVFKVLKKHKYKAFKIKPVQNLHEGDAVRRYNFCQWLTQNCQNNSSFLGNIIWSDESNFSNKQKFNRKNTHVWSTNTPHATAPIETQARFSTNVWCAVTKDKIYGPYFYAGTLTAARYLELLRCVVPDIMNEIALSRVADIIFQHDGAPPHRSQNIQQYLRQEFNTWIGHGGTVEWPPRSPDLTPLDFSIWGIIKDDVYASGVHSLEELKARITRALNRISSQTLQKNQANIMKRVALCMNHNGATLSNIYDE